jgi:uncharacterized protein with beta-barrel porin domain
VQFNGVATFSNSAAITGGSGGDSGNTNGGAGGVGVLFNAAATFNNSGIITGGAGGSGATSGADGAGVVGANLVIINSGGISGGGLGAANAITFTGGTNQLELQAGSSIVGNVVAFSTADTLRLGGAGNASLDASLIGTQYLGFGVFQKAGSSIWTLTGTNAAALPWSINGGTLNVAGTLANSTMTVNPGGALAGTGTVGNTQVNSGGTFAPGSGVPGSSMTVAGNLAFQSAAMYMITVSGANASNANVMGSATLGGTVQVAFASAPTAKSYDILHSGGLGGTTFGAVTAANYNASLSYTATDVLLNINGAALGNTSMLNQNQQAVANAISAFSNSGGTLPAGFAALFGLTGGNLANALTQLDGEAATDAEKGAFALMNQFLGLMLDPFVDGRFGTSGGPIGFAPDQQTNFPPDIALAYASVLKAPPPQTFDQRWTAWGSGFGASSTTNGNAAIGSNNVTTADYGFAGGMDYHATPNTLYGFALAGAGTNWNLAQGLGSGRSDAFQAGVYGKSYWGPAYVAAALAFSDNWFSTNRMALGDELTARFAGQSYGGRLETGYRYAVPVGGTAAGVTPYAAIQTQWFHMPTYSETDLSGGGLGLTYNAVTANDTRSELGARLDDPTLLNGMPLILRARLAWAHDWVTNPALDAVFQSLPGSNFIVNGATPPKDSALASAGAQYFLSAAWSFTAKFDGEFASSSQTYGGSGTLRYTW